MTRRFWIALVLALSVAVGCSDGEASRTFDVSISTTPVQTTPRPVTTTTTTTPTSTTVASVPTAHPAEPTPTVATAAWLPTLSISDAAAPVAYDRTRDFGDWIDADGDCQNSRAEALIAESAVPVSFTSPGECTVAAGQWIDPWSGEVNVIARTLDVDHTVPLANAWRSGAWSWSPQMRIAFANFLDEPAHLIAIPLGHNRSKGDRGPDVWRPPDQAAWCSYAKAWAGIKTRWNLTATASEWAALVEMAASC